MAENALGTTIVCQVGIIVEDIAKTSKAWAELLGVEVPAAQLTDGQEVTHARYRGEGTDARAKLAFFNLGQVQLDLIEPVGGPSTWREFLEQHGQGIHHIAFRIQGMDDVIARLEACDVSLVQRGDYTGGRYAYLDGIPQLGAILELLEND
jgi:methylmalonyl-CoA/ethylmalonyl-CoA epimerase